jgi:hypothetical protein
LEANAVTIKHFALALALLLAVAYSSQAQTIGTLYVSYSKADDTITTKTDAEAPRFRLLKGDPRQITLSVGMSTTRLTPVGLD